MHCRAARSVDHGGVGVADAAAQRCRARAVDAAASDVPSRRPEYDRRVNRPVVIVEDRADLPFGHYSILCSDLASAYASLGHPVEMLTRCGWAGEWDGRSRRAPFTVRRYGRRAARRAERGPRWRVVSMIGAARAHRRRLRDPSTLVVVISYAFDPILAAALCGPGDWLFYQFGPIGSPPRTLARRAFAWGARRAEH